MEDSVHQYQREACLDIYILQLIKCLCSINEFFYCLRWGAYHRVMIDNHEVLT